MFSVRQLVVLLMCAAGGATAAAYVRPVAPPAQPDYRSRVDGGRPSFGSRPAPANHPTLGASNDRPRNLSSTPGPSQPAFRPSTMPNQASRLRDQQRVESYQPVPTRPAAQRVEAPGYRHDGPDRVAQTQRWHRPDTANRSDHDRWPHNAAWAGRDGRHRHPAKPPAVRDHQSGHWYHWDRHRDHGDGHRTVVFWAGGWPLCYYYPWTGYVQYVEPSTYYEYPPPPLFGGDQLNYSYHDLGVKWGQDLRGSLASWEQFVQYLHDYIVDAPSLARDEFRRGFEAGYGANATLVFDQAFNQAQ